MMNRLSVLLAALLLLTSASFLMAIKIDDQRSGKGQVELQTNTLSITITGNRNVPMFVLRFLNESTGAVTSGYKVQFDRIHQRDASHQIVPSSNVALASLDYNFSNFQTDTDGSVHFNITSTGTPSFEFRIHATPSANSFKFDTVVRNVQESFWFSSAKYLALCYKTLDRSNDKSIDPSVKGRRGDFGKAYFEIVPTGKTNRDEIVNATLSAESASVCVEYARWNGTEMVHDPTIGLMNAALTLKASSVLIVVMFILAMLF
ncbi:hypothetical protein C9374_009970 [Naegleria lovaniensis]|uniref:Uncharacterized protein n=1 Tax=Naegleria lovaniensis TaxID=51637 RepID=A0AA88GD72_NAELO|nr:uncharacterized protein C9374_009970 [Naegleria lovaniensis]KAG2375347.1 hypothetical protein C9374_009970 [Naegleria lovaniensis]